MNKSNVAKLGVAIQIACILCAFLFLYFAATYKNPFLLLLAFLPYVVFYNILFRGIISLKLRDKE